MSTSGLAGSFECKYSVVVAVTDPPPTTTQMPPTTPMSPIVSFKNRMPVVLPRPNIMPHVPGEKDYAAARWGTLESRSRDVTSSDTTGKTKKAGARDDWQRFDNTAGGVSTHHRLGIDQQGG